MSISPLIRPRICSSPVTRRPVQLHMPFRAAWLDTQGTSQKMGSEG